MTDDDLIDTAEVGAKAKEFLESDAGQSLLAFLEADEKDAIDGLGRVNPSDTAGIMCLQVDLRAARKCREKLDELVRLGEEAKISWRKQRESNEP